MQQRPWRRTGRWVPGSAIVLLLALVLLGCTHQRPERLPGETDIVVDFVTIEGADGKELALDPSPLFRQLGLRPGSALITHRYFNQFRLAEDRRRLSAYWQTYGYFDVEVDEPVVKFADGDASVSVTWRVREGERFTIASVEMRQAPPEYAEALEERVTFGRGDTIDMEKYRRLRHDMAEVLRRAGYGHAVVYSRTFVDRKKKEVHWFYYVDSGPQTTIGVITIEGAHKIPEAEVLARMGLAPGDPYTLTVKEQAELDLLDTGAYASVAIKPTEQAERVIPGVAPDTGGIIEDDRVDEAGRLRPRELPKTVDLRVVVVEAPSVQARLGAGAEADPTRADVYTGAALRFRNLFGPQHHVLLEGTVGYGFLFGDEDEPDGVYGTALARYVRPRFIGRLFDARLTARYRDRLFPGFHLRDVVAGPGGRAKLGPSLFLDVDAYFRFERAIRFGPFDAATRDAFVLTGDRDAQGAELEASMVLDERDDPVEPMSGFLLGLGSVYSPGGELSSHRYVQLAPEARAFVPLSASWSVGLKTSAAWVVADDGSGVPVGARLFGGGAYGFRGLGRQRLSPTAPCAAAATCDDELVGGLSLAEGSLEARFLPFRQQIGLVGFLDAGGASASRNPFERGVSLAVGIGPRVRIWYLPIAVDVAYRFVEDGDTVGPKPFDPYAAFLRIGEAF